VANPQATAPTGVGLPVCEELSAQPQRKTRYWLLHPAGSHESQCGVRKRHPFKMNAPQSALIASSGAAREIFRKDWHVRGGHLRLVLHVGSHRCREACGEAHVVRCARHSRKMRERHLTNLSRMRDTHMTHGHRHDSLEFVQIESLRRARRLREHQELEAVGFARYDDARAGGHVPSIVLCHRCLSSGIPCVATFFSAPAPICQRLYACQRRCGSATIHCAALPPAGVCVWLDLTMSSELYRKSHV